MFLVLLKWEVAAILGNECGVQGQNYVAWLSRGKMSVGGGRVMRWQGGKGRRVVRWESGRFLVLLKGGEHKMSPRFYLFVSDVIQGNKGAV